MIAAAAKASLVLVDQVAFVDATVAKIRPVPVGLTALVRVVVAKVSHVLADQIAFANVTAATKTPSSKESAHLLK